MSDLVPPRSTFEDQEQPFIELPAVKGLSSSLAFSDAAKETPFADDMGASLIELGLGGTPIGPPESGIDILAPVVEDPGGKAFARRITGAKGESVVTQLGDFMASYKAVKGQLLERGLRCDLEMTSAQQLANELAERSFGADWRERHRLERRQEIWRSAMLGAMVENAVPTVADDTASNQLAFEQVRGEYRFMPQNVTAKQYSRTMRNAETELASGPIMSTQTESPALNLLYKWQFNQNPSFQNHADQRQWLQTTTRPFKAYKARADIKDKWSRVNQHVPFERIDPTTHSLDMKEYSWLGDAATEDSLLRAADVALGDRFKYAQRQTRTMLAQALNTREEFPRIMQRLFPDPAARSHATGVLGAVSENRITALEKLVNSGVARRGGGTGRQLAGAATTVRLDPGAAARYQEFFDKTTLNFVAQQDRDSVKVPILDVYPEAYTLQAKAEAEGNRYHRDLTQRKLNEALNKYTLPRALFHLQERIGHMVEKTGITGFQKKLFGPLMREWHKSYFEEGGVFKKPRGEMRSVATWHNPGEWFLEQTGVMNPGLNSAMGRYAERMAAGTAGTLDHIGVTAQMFYQGMLGMIGHAADQPLSLLLFDRALKAGHLGRTKIGRFLTNRKVNPRIVGAVELALDPIGGFEPLRKIYGYSSSGAARLGRRESQVVELANRVIKDTNDRGSALNFLKASKRDHREMYNTPAAAIKRTEAFYDMLESDIRTHGKLRLDTMFRATQEIGHGLDPTMVNDTIGGLTAGATARLAAGSPASRATAWLQRAAQLEALDGPKAKEALAELRTAPEVYLTELLNAKRKTGRQQALNMIGRAAQRMGIDNRVTRNLVAYGENALKLVEELPEVAMDSASMLAARRAKLGEYQSFDNLYRHVSTTARRVQNENLEMAAIIQQEIGFLAGKKPQLRRQLQLARRELAIARKKRAATGRYVRKPKGGPQTRFPREVEGQESRFVKTADVKRLEEGVRNLEADWADLNGQLQVLPVRLQGHTGAANQSKRAGGEIDQAIIQLRNRQQHGIGSSPRAETVVEGYTPDFSKGTLEYLGEYLADLYLLDGLPGKKLGHPGRLLEIHNVLSSQVQVARGKANRSFTHVNGVLTQLLSRKITPATARGKMGLKPKPKLRKGETPLNNALEAGVKKIEQARAKMDHLERLVAKRYRTALKQPGAWAIEGLLKEHQTRFNLLRGQFNEAFDLASTGVDKGSGPAGTLMTMMQLSMAPSATQNRANGLLAGYVDSQFDLAKVAVSIANENSAWLPKKDRVMLDHVQAGRIDMSDPRVSAEVYTIAFENSKLRPALWEKLADYRIISPEAAEVMAGRQYRGRVPARELLQRQIREGANPTEAPRRPKAELRKPGFHHANVQASTRHARVLKRTNKVSKDGDYEWDYSQETFDVADHGGAKEANKAAKTWVEEQIAAGTIDRKAYEIVNAVTPETLGLKGMIDDQGFIQPYVFQKHMADIAKIEMFNHVGRLKGMVRTDLAGVPKQLRGEWTRVEDSAKWGPISGKYVSRDFVKSIGTWDGWSNTLRAAAEGMKEAVSDVWQPAWGGLEKKIFKDPSSVVPSTLRWVDRQLRTMLITTNLGSWTNNHMGNLQSAFMAGINPFSATYWRNRSSLNDILGLISKGKFGPEHRDFDLWQRAMANGLGSASVGTEGSARLSIEHHTGGGIFAEGRRKFRSRIKKQQREVDILEQTIERMERLHDIHDPGTIGTADKILELREALALKTKEMVKSNTTGEWTAIMKDVGRSLAGRESTPGVIRETLAEAYGAIDMGHKWAYLKTATEKYGLSADEAVSNMASYFQNYSAVGPWVRNLKKAPITGAFVPAFPAEALRTTRNAIARDPVRFMTVLLAPLAANLANMVAHGITPSDFFDQSHATNTFEQMRELLFNLHVNAGDVQMRVGLGSGSNLSPFAQAGGLARTRIEKGLTPWVEDNFGSMASAVASIGANFASQFAVNTPLLSGVMDVGAGVNLNEGTIDARAEEGILNTAARHALQLIEPGTVRSTRQRLAETGTTSLITRHNRPALLQLGKVAGVNVNTYPSRERAARLALKYYSLRGRALVWQQANETRQMLKKYAIRHQLLLESGSKADAAKADQVLEEGIDWGKKNLSYRKVIGARVVDRAYTRKEIADQIINHASSNVRRIVSGIPVRNKADYVMDLTSSLVARQNPEVERAAWEELTDATAISRYTDVEDLQALVEKCARYAGTTTDPNKQRMFTVAASKLMQQLIAVARRQAGRGIPHQLRQLQKARPGARQRLMHQLRQRLQR